jgi:hypothetical protein
MADDVSRKLDELRRQATQKFEEARSIVASMNIVETLFDLPLTELESLATATVSGGVLSGSYASGVVVQPPGDGDVWNQTPTPPRRRTGSPIRPDEFFGEEPLEAAKRFLRRVGHAMQFEEIAESVQAGGAAIRGADWRERLEISLKRSPYQVITVSDGTYGLAEFYTEDQLKRFRGTKRSESEPTAKKKPKPKAKAKPKAPKQLKAATEEKLKSEESSEQASEPVLLAKIAEFPR